MHESFINWHPSSMYSIVSKQFTGLLGHHRAYLHTNAAYNIDRDIYSGRRSNYHRYRGEKEMKKNEKGNQGVKEEGRKLAATSIFCTKKYTKSSMCLLIHDIKYFLLLVYDTRLYPLIKRPLFLQLIKNFYSISFATHFQHDNFSFFHFCGISLTIEEIFGNSLFILIRKCNMKRRIQIYDKRISTLNTNI